MNFGLFWYVYLLVYSCVDKGFLKWYNSVCDNVNW